MNIVLLGGNGYIGRATTNEWIKKDPSAHFYIVSRSGKNKLQSPNITNLAADVSDFESVLKVLPNKVDYIVDFVGRPEKNVNESDKVNNQPAKVMRKIAEEKNVKAMGFVGGKLGPNYFVKTKKDILNFIRKSTIKLGYVEPTLVYGNDRKDSLAKMIWLFKIMGIFSKKLRPVHVQDVAQELINNILN